MGRRRPSAPACASAAATRRCSGPRSMPATPRRPPRTTSATWSAVGSLARRSSRGRALGPMSSPPSSISSSRSTRRWLPRRPDSCTEKGHCRGPDVRRPRLGPGGPRPGDPLRAARHRQDLDRAPVRGVVAHEAGAVTPMPCCRTQLNSRRGREVHPGAARATGMVGRRQPRRVVLGPAVQRRERRIPLRPYKSNYELLQPGDLVVGYQANPDKRIVALARIAQGLHPTAEGPQITMEPVAKGRDGITYEELLEDPRPRDQRADALPEPGNALPPRRCRGRQLLAGPLPNETRASQTSRRSTRPRASGTLTRVTFHPRTGTRTSSRATGRSPTTTGQLNLALERRHLQARLPGRARRPGAAVPAADRRDQPRQHRRRSSAS